FRGGAHGAEHTAPTAPGKDDRDEHQREPQAPDQEIRREGEVVEEAGVVARRRQRERQHDQYQKTHEHRAVNPGQPVFVPERKAFHTLREQPLGEGGAVGVAVWHQKKAYSRRATSVVSAAAPLRPNSSTMPNSSSRSLPK